MTIGFVLGRHYDRMPAMRLRSKLLRRLRVFDGGPVKRLRRWLCQRFGWHSKAWVSPADRFDTCLACGEQFPHSCSLTSNTRRTDPVDK
jgi:hypothetical protein